VLTLHLILNKSNELSVNYFQLINKSLILCCLYLIVNLRIDAVSRLSTGGSVLSNHPSDWWPWGLLWLKGSFVAIGFWGRPTFWPLIDQAWSWHLIGSKTFPLDAKEEASLSKNRRDWAFSERDKIVQERESIRRQCDELRRERDRTVSEHVEVLRELDELKKSKSHTTQELKEVRFVLHHFCAQFTTPVCLSIVLL